VCPALLGDTRYDKFIEITSNTTVIEMRVSLVYRNDPGIGFRWIHVRIQ